ncbi:unnamed protein product, partial [marine sediment metagenome]
NLPPDPEVKVDIAESNLLTLRMNKKGEIFYNFGIESPKRLERSRVRAFLRERAQSNPKLVTLLKIDRAGKFEMMVDLIDEFNLADVKRFSLGPLLESDKRLIEKISS